MNPVPTSERRRSKDCRIQKLLVKAREKISDDPMISRKKPESLNKMPSPSEILRSSPGTRTATKRALLIGVTYKKKYMLKGTINDVKSMRELLIKNFGFKEENIQVLTDLQMDTTRKKMVESMEWLVKDCQAGDSLVFYFSGHGIRKLDFEGDERDGFDENICPVDFLTEGIISDNEINSLIVWPLKKDVTLHAIVDACHSGTVLDLEHFYNREQKRWEDNSPPSGNARKHTDGGMAISISACQDHEIAVDTSVRYMQLIDLIVHLSLDQEALELAHFSVYINFQAFTKTMNGALTYLLVYILKKYPGLTYGDLLDLIHEELSKFNEGGCLPAKFLRKIFKNQLLQTPQISSSKPFDVYNKHFLFKDCRIQKQLVKAREKISDDPMISRKKPESLNKMPSPSEILRSSPGTRTATKRALLIGVTYKKKYMLKGTINDVKSMRELLIKNFGFKEENIQVLTEQDTTRKKMVESMEWLVKDCQAGDSLVFYFSGHGIRKLDFEGDERMISDNEINSLIVWPLKKDVTLHAIVDAHSGTVLDLEHVYNREQKRWEDNSPPSGNARKHTDGGLAISISACQDHEIVVDTSAFTKSMNGALTYLLVYILKKYPGLTYGDLLDLIHEELSKFNEGGSLPAKFLRKIFKNQLLQTPQMSSSKPFDVYKKHFLL
uniref:Peptidase C14 caspase domain-containing protein n=1 Tax=Salix viminalis TaxID=40686 RepID=A0A6N2MV95_SALVM